MKNISLKTIVIGMVAGVVLSGCGETTNTDTFDSEPVTTNDSVTVSTGYYGENNDLGTPTQIRFYWLKLDDTERTLYLTSSIDTSTDGYLLSTYGSPHYNYSITKVKDKGIYAITCDVGVYTADWVKYSCYTDFNNTTLAKDPTIDNSFVIDYTSHNRVYAWYDNSTVTLADVVYPD